MADARTAAERPDDWSLAFCCDTNGGNEQPDSTVLLTDGADGDAWEIMQKLRHRPGEAGTASEGSSEGSGGGGGGADGLTLHDPGHELHHHGHGIEHETGFRKGKCCCNVCCRACTCRCCYRLPLLGMSVCFAMLCRVD